MNKFWFELTKDERRQILIAKGEDPDLAPRGVYPGVAPTGLRNWVCEVDGHADPDNSGLCIHCAVNLYPDDGDD
jgi:hypothetical protein